MPRRRQMQARGRGKEAPKQKSLREQKRQRRKSMKA